MRIKFRVLILFFVYCMISAFQCNKCKTGTYRLDATKSWFPLKGRTQLLFVDTSGTATNFNIRVVDTLEAVQNDCVTPYKIEYIETTLYLDSAKNDYIFFGLGIGGILTVRANSDNNTNISMYDVFGKAKQGINAQELSNFSVGNKIYNKAIIMFHLPGQPATIDSIIIANDAGIVGFKYSGKKYSLQ